MRPILKFKSVNDKEESVSSKTRNKERERVHGSPTTTLLTIDSSSTLSYLRYRGLSSTSKKKDWFDYYFDEKKSRGH
jgi:hypothetical protein